MQIVFKSCMKYRKELVKKSANIDESFVIKRVTEAAEKTLCPKPEGINYHNIKCLERECTECGVDNTEFLPEETSGEVTVSWSRYEYVSTGKFLTNGQEKRKIALVQKEAPPSELFGYFKELLVEYPRHSFMARWQREQLDSLLNPPPPNTCCLCAQLLRGLWMQITRRNSVWVLWRCQGISTRHHTAPPCCGSNWWWEEHWRESHLIKEHIFVISEDPVQDHDSVHTCQALITKYLLDISCKVDQMHEFTLQALCWWPILLSCWLWLYHSKNYFETSHAKGEQDAAGSHVKQKVSQAVFTRSATINNAKAMHKFLTEKFTQPAASSFTARTNSVQLKRRVFFYVPGKGEGAVIRNRPGRKFKEVKGIRKLHCIKTGSEQEKVLARQHSCYCISCTHDDEENCPNKAWLDDWKEVLVCCKL